MSDTSNPAKAAALRQLIAVRAYEMWENQGRPQGYDAIHWCQAEQDVLGSMAEASAAQPAPAKVRKKRKTA